MEQLGGECVLCSLTGRYEPAVLYRVCKCVYVVGGGGGRVKNWYFSLKDSEGGGISEIKIQKKNKKKKTEHSEIKQYGNNNNSVPKSTSILNKFEKGEVLRWSLRKKIQRHTLYRLDTVVLKLS